MGARKRSFAPHLVYTVQMDDWLRQNFAILRMSQLKAAFDAEFGTDASLSGLCQHANNTLNLKKANQHKYTDEELSFIDFCIVDGLDWKETTRRFNERFKCHLPVNAIKCTGINHRITHDVVKGVRFSAEQEAWLRENVPGSASWNDVARRFNEAFGVIKAQTALRSKCRQMRPKVYINGGTTGHHAGQVTWNLQPDGTERTRSGKWDYQYIKVGDKWIPKQKVIYEQAFGELPEGMFVIFLDGNKRNFDLDNLYPVSRAVHARMCQNNWYTESREHTLTALKYCELDRTIKTGGIT